MAVLVVMVTALVVLAVIDDGVGSVGGVGVGGGGGGGDGSGGGD